MPASISGAQTHARAFASASLGPTQAQKRLQAASAAAASSQPAAVSIGPLSAADACTDRQPHMAQQQLLPAFVKGSAFSGARPGYVFKKGSQGLGYYLEKSAANLPGKKAKQQRQAEVSHGRSAATEQQQDGEEEETQAMSEEDMQPIKGVQPVTTPCKSSPFLTIFTPFTTLTAFDLPGRHCVSMLYTCLMSFLPPIASHAQLFAFFSGSTISVEQPVLHYHLRLPAHHLPSVHCGATAESKNMVPRSGAYLLNMQGSVCGYVCLSCCIQHEVAHDNSKGFMDAKCSPVQEQITTQHDEKLATRFSSCWFAVCSCTAEHFASINSFSHTSCMLSRTACCCHE